MTIYPVLKYQDAHAAIDFLERAFGAERLEAMEGDDGAILHAELRLFGTPLMVSSTGGDNTIYDQGAGRSVVYVAVDEVDSLYERALDEGAEIILEPTDQDYGSRDFSARDPEGNIWSFGTYRPGE